MLSGGESKTARPDLAGGSSMNVSKRLFITVGLSVILAVIAASAIGARVSEAENPLVRELREVLRKENPAIGHVAILELRAVTTEGPYVMIGWGIRADRRFEGDFRDELFGVFLVNSTLTRIERTFEIIATPRWLDYSLRIEDITAERIIVVGRGLTYGDSVIKRIYMIRQ